MRGAKPLTFLLALGLSSAVAQRAPAQAAPANVGEAEVRSPTSTEDDEPDAAAPAAPEATAVATDTGEQVAAASSDAEPTAGASREVLAIRHAQRSPGPEEGLPSERTSASASSDPASAAKSAKKKRPKWQRAPKLEVRGAVRALYSVEHNESSTVEGFALRSARLEGRWTQGKLLRAVVEAEFGKEGSAEGALDLLRDAYIRVRPLRELELKVGQFKKSFSRLELTGRSDLVLVSRGLSNDWIVEDLGFGDRDLGLQVSGRLLKNPDLDYALGVFDGSGRNRTEEATDATKDVVARVEVEPIKWLELGLNGSLKLFDQDVLPEHPKASLMGGIDAELDAGRLKVVSEGMFGDNPLSIDRARSWSVLLLASYDIPLARKKALVLVPLIKGEVLKVEHHVKSSHILSATAGANLVVAKHFALMVQGELDRTFSNTLPQWSDEQRLFVQAAYFAN